MNESANFNVGKFKILNVRDLDSYLIYKLLQYLHNKM